MKERRIPSSGAVLHRTPELSIRLDSSNEVSVRLPDGSSVLIGNRGLIVLDVFASPRSTADAVEALRPRMQGAQDFIDVTTAIATLYEAGVLVDADDDEQAAGSPGRGWADPFAHVSMLNDRERTASFLAALDRRVRPDDVVLDLGTGSGVLAAAAAKAGARHVYAIEASGIEATARAVFEANGVGDRVTIVPGWSTQVELPERATVLVSETIGNEPFGERVLEALLDARSRLLAPDPVMIPQGLRVFGYPVSLPETERALWCGDPALFERWLSWYGLDLTPLRAAFGDASRLRMARSADVAHWQSLAEARELVAIDFSSLSSLMVEGHARMSVETSGRVDAIVSYWDLALDGEGGISTRPAVGRYSSWGTPVWVLPSPIEVRAGDELVVSYRYRVPGHPEGVSVTVAS